jgi:very-short-patch-repair endonuclease
MPKTRRSGRRNAAVLRARELRREMSLPEGLLWQVLRQRPAGLKFRRQHPFVRCTADFYCAAVRLVVEVDGDQHSRGTIPSEDAARDAWLAGRGVMVLRFDAAEVLKDLESVVTALVPHALGRLPLHHPSGGPPPHLPMGRHL